MNAEWRDRIHPNQHVLIRLPSQNIKVAEMAPGAIINLGKFGSFRTDDIIGDPFGFTYEIGANMELTIVDDPEYFAFNESDETLGKEQTQDGDMIKALGHQTVTMAEIEALKKQGVSGEQIIERVTGGNDDFSHKTEYSKQKYMTRKKQKFLQQFTPQAIGTPELVDLYLDKDAAKIMNVSLETLALALTYGNVHPGGTYLVVDESAGILVAAMLERMNNTGTIVVLHESEHPNLSCLRYLGLHAPQYAENIKTINYLDLLHPEEIEERVGERNEAELAELKPAQRGAYYRARRRQDDHDWVRGVAARRGFDALLVMTELNLGSIVPPLVDLLEGSRPIVLYSEFKEQLVEMTNQLKGDVRVLAPTIMEARVRRYQTLPGRIHPLMTSRGYGGYLLWATRVIPAANAHAVGRGYLRRKKPRTDVDVAGTAIAEISSETQNDVSSDLPTADAEPSTGIAAIAKSF